MSHGARSAAAVMLGLGVLMTAGIAAADCGPTHSAQTTVTTPSPDQAGTPVKPSESGRG